MNADTETKPISYPIEVRKFMLETVLKKKYGSNEEFEKIVNNPVEMNKIQTDLQTIQKSDYWGRITWTFLHVMSSKIKDDYFDSFKSEYLEMCKKICKNVPCSVCRKHANIVIDNIDFELIKTKNDLQSFFYDFHNSVNIGTDKPVFSEENLSKYNEINTEIVIAVFKIIMEKTFKKDICDDFNVWISANQDKFN
jgi:hypothetical protein